MLSTLSCCGALAAMTLLAPPAMAYGHYSNTLVQPATPADPPPITKRNHIPGSLRCQDQDGDNRCQEPWGNCKTCHGNFRATNKDDDDPALKDPYKSPVDGKQWRVKYKGEWVVGLHDIHVKVILDNPFTTPEEGDFEPVCGVCHRRDATTGAPAYPVFIGSSAGWPDYKLAGISCVGCHGRDEDQYPGGSNGKKFIAGCPESTPPLGECISLRGAGLRRHHVKAGVTECKTCHLDADPDLPKLDLAADLEFTPVGENKLPPYYNFFATYKDVFPNAPTDPCGRTKRESYAPGFAGLDNDGDGSYDWLDRDCRPTGPRK